VPQAQLAAGEYRGRSRRAIRATSFSDRAALAVETGVSSNLRHHGASDLLGLLANSARAIGIPRVSHRAPAQQQRSDEIEQAVVALP
jgi:hypothetical protein